MWWFFYAVDLTFLFGILTFLQQSPHFKKNIFGRDIDLWSVPK
jgi:hypothetical protein